MLILASTSSTRQKMLEDAGVKVLCKPHNFDESEAKFKFRHLTAKDLAQQLAQGKALSLNDSHPQTFIIGSDQTLECEGQIFTKPKTIAEARQQIQTLMGRDHKLHSAIALTNKGRLVWSYCDTATLRMRNLSPQFIENYFTNEGEDIINSVGAYHIETRGIQLFEAIDGHHHTILGMPMLELLQKLREHAVIMS